MKIIIVGASQTGVTLANLMGEDHDITILEVDSEKAKKLSEETAALVILGDACDLSALQEAGLSEADAVVATSDDKTNLMVCEIAKNEKIKKVVSLVNDPKKEELFTQLGITQIVSVVGTNVTEIKRLLYQVGDERIIAQLGKGEVQIIEQTVSKNSELIGQKTFVNGANIAALYRSGEIIIPHADTVIEENDVVIVVVRTEDVEKVNKLIKA